MLIRYIQRRKFLERVTLTPEGFAYLTVVSFITIGSVLRNVNLLILMTGILLAPLLINWRLAVHRVRTLRGRRQLPSRINANQMVNVHWHCDNSSGSVPAMNVIVKDIIRRAPPAYQTLAEELPRSQTNDSQADLRFFGELRDRFLNHPERHSTVVAQIRFQRLLAGQADTQTSRMLFPQRGKYWVGPAKIHCWFPFGLILSRQRLGQECSVMVGPELGFLNSTWEKRLNSTAKGTDSVRKSRAVEEDDFFALRRWRSGDSRKNIHWRSTAKQRFPIVKQFVERNNRDFALVLDLFVDDVQPQTLKDCETALSFAATTLLAAKTVAEGRASFAVCGKTLEAYRSNTVSGIVAECTPALAVAAGDQAPPIAQGIVSCLDTVSNSTPIYVISSRDMPANLSENFPQETTDDSEATSLGKNQSSDAVQDRLHHSKYVKRRLRTGLPMVRWLNVQSNDFKEIFALDKTPKQTNNTPQAMPADLAEASQKWIDHAQR